MIQVTSAIKEREEAVATKNRLDHMQEGKKEFVKVLNDKHKKDYQVIHSWYTSFSLSICSGKTCCV